MVACSVGGWYWEEHLCWFEGACDKKNFGQVWWLIVGVDECLGGGDDRWDRLLGQKVEVAEPTRDVNPSSNSGQHKSRRNMNERWVRAISIRL